MSFLQPRLSMTGSFKTAKKNWCMRDPTSNWLRSILNKIYTSTSEKIKVNRQPKSAAGSQHMHGYFYKNKHRKHGTYQCNKKSIENTHF